MSDFFFVVKAFIVTLVLVCTMQIRVGGRTIEQRSMAWVHESSTVDNLRMVAEGAVKAMGVGYRTVANFLDHQVGKAFEDQGPTGPEID